MALINTTTTGILGTTVYGDGAGALTVQQDGVTINKITVAPAFSAVWTGGVQSVSSSTFTKVQVALEEFDTNSNYDTSTYRFTPTVAGYYQVNGVVACDASSSGTRIISSIYKNGSEFKRGTYMVPYNSSTGVAIVSCLIYFNGTTDYVELYGYMSATSPKFGGNANETYFQAVLVRAA